MSHTLTLLACLLALGMLVGSASADEAKPVVLEPGDKAPDFAGETDEGKPWKSADHVGEKVIVVYFYPKDMTPGCTKQACTYRDMQEDFAGKEVEIIGVSGDTVESHQKFKKEHDLNFTLLADPKGEIAKAFGVKLLSNSPDSIVTSRWTFIIDDEGKIAYKNDKVDAAKDPATVLKVIEELEEKKSSPPIKVSVSRGADGGVVLFMNDEQTDEAGLRQLIDELGASRDNQRVNLTADQDIAYSEVIGVMDLLRELGLQKIAVAAKHVDGQ